jgi:hypothetical protein
VTDVHVRREEVGFVRRRITGKRRRPEVARCAPAMTDTPIDQFTLQGCGADGNDRGTVGGANLLQPCDELPCGDAREGVEQLPALRASRRRVAINVGDTRMAECRDVQGIGEACRGIAENGEMNTQKYTFRCPSEELQEDVVLQLGATAGGVVHRADHAVAMRAAAALDSAVTAACDSPPVRAG